MGQECVGGGGGGRMRHSWRGWTTFCCRSAPKTRPGRMGQECWGRGDESTHGVVGQHSAADQHPRQGQVGWGRNVRGRGGGREDECTHDVDG